VAILSVKPELEQVSNFGLVRSRDSVSNLVLDPVLSSNIKVKKVKHLNIYIPPLTRKPWPAAFYNSKWRTDRQWH